MGSAGRDCPGAPDPAPGAAGTAREVFVVGCSPGQPPLTVELTLHPTDGNYTGIAQPKAGDVRSFLYDPKSGSSSSTWRTRAATWPLMLREADAMAAALEDEPDDDY